MVYYGISEIQKFRLYSIIVDNVCQLIPSRFDKKEPVVYTTFVCGIIATITSIRSYKLVNVISGLRMHITSVREGKALTRNNDRPAKSWRFC